MDKDIQHQISYVKDKVINLADLCKKETTIEVSGSVRSLTQDILTNLNRLLDMIMYYFYYKKIRPTLTETESSKYDKNVYFPVCNDQNNMKSSFGNFGGLKVKSDHLIVFDLIESVQPYNGNSWIKQLREYSNLGHRKLISQTKKKDDCLVLGNTIKINSKASAEFSNCLIGGYLVKNLKVTKGSINGCLDSRLNPRIETNTIYLVENSDINVIYLCQKSIQEIEKIFTKIDSYIKS